MASWEVVSPHISSSMEQNSSSSSNGNNRPKVGFHISDLHAANEGEGGGTKKVRPNFQGRPDLWEFDHHVCFTTYLSCLCVHFFLSLLVG